MSRRNHAYTPCVLILKFASVVGVCICWDSTETEMVLEKVQEFIISLSNFTEGENQRLSGEVSPKCQTEPTEFSWRTLTHISSF